MTADIHVWEDPMLQRIALAIVILTVGVSYISCDTAGVKRLSDGRSQYGETKSIFNQLDDEQ